MKIEKRPLTLIEVSISLFLLAILLSFLFTFLSQTVKTKVKMANAKSYVLDRQHLSMRLNQVFSAVQTGFYTEEEKGHPALSFIFDNGIDPEPSFSGPVRGKLFLEKEHLTLQIEPARISKKMDFRKEILLGPIKDFSLTFLAKMEEKFPDPKAKKIGSSYQWRTFWPKEKSGVPSLIRLVITENISQKRKKGDTTSFAFFLPSQDIPVTYKKDEKE
ncbi:MAG TPA: hypothetical protein VLG44_03960 [Chlamydiales bacterium]|nr:hypothetical protein [Chlamydiales bacterium]